VAIVIQTFTCATALLEYGVASVTAADQDESGDRHLVKTIHDGALLAVVDGSGHGREAGRTARLAVETLEAYANEDVVSLFQRCHQRLRSTRGAVMSIASINAAQSTISWAGVGNIEGMILRFGSSPLGPVDRLLVRPGIVGYRLPYLRAMDLPIAPGDLIILATDGIRPDFEKQIMPDEHPKLIAKKISSGHRKPDDDGLVLVAQYLGDDERS
jgi:negative regulator of sigma-B (phosphoserine phosphatase)